ncbi:hypothetical protein J3A83DRAFT_215091 [Scleroderma citrinum]
MVVSLETWHPLDMASAAQAEDASFPPGFPLSLRLDGESTPATFHVIRPFTPFTKAQVYLVRPESHKDFPSPLVLKVFDPRYLDDRFPKHAHRPSRPWTLAAESLAIQKREQGEITDDFDIYQLDEEEAEPWHWEAHFFNLLEGSFESEVLAYKRLVELQGQFIPKFYGSGRLIPTPPKSRAIEPGAILIEYIPGVLLRDIDPALVLPKLYRPLMKAVAIFDERGVIHYDINENNVMFTPPEAPERAVIIDFGCAGLRQEGVSDEEWENTLKGD